MTGRSQLMDPWCLASALLLGLAWHGGLHAWMVLAASLASHSEIDWPSSTTVSMFGFRPWRSR